MCLHDFPYWMQNKQNNKISISKIYKSLTTPGLAFLSIRKRMSLIVGLRDHTGLAPMWVWEIIGGKDAEAF